MPHRTVYGGGGRLRYVMRLRHSGYAEKRRRLGGGAARAANNRGDIEGGRLKINKWREERN